MEKEIESYIASRYPAWLEYAAYQTKQAGIPDEKHDVLNEVICNLLSKDPRLIEELYQRQGDTCRQLDYYVLRMIWLNVVSPTSPYRCKMRNGLVDDSVELERLRVIDDTDEEDRAGTILSQMRQVRRVLEELPLPEKAKRVFAWKFFEGNSLLEWEGPEGKNYLYKTYNKVKEAIRKKISGEIRSGFLF